MWIENWLREEKETQKKDREEPEQKNLAEKKQEEKESGKNYTEEKKRITEKKVKAKKLTPESQTVSTTLGKRIQKLAERFGGTERKEQRRRIEREKNNETEKKSWTSEK